MPSRHPTPAERDERVAIPLDPEEALRGLLAVQPDGDEAGPEVMNPDELSAWAKKQPKEAVGDFNSRPKRPPSVINEREA